MGPLRPPGPLVALAILAAPSAALAGTGSVTLAASPASVEYGHAVTLSGGVSPAAAGETVSIVAEGSGATLAAAATDASGGYSVRVVPDRSLRLHAEWGPTESAPVDLEVRPLLSVSLDGVLLFGRAEVAGAVQPAEGGSVRVTLYRGEAVAARLDVPLAGGSFAASLRVERPGTYRAEAVFADDDHLPVRATSDERQTPLPRLRLGSRGVFVRLLEERLRELRYRLPSADRRFDARTADAVLAFHKVQGKRRVGAVDASTWRALASPAVPKPRSRGGGSHVEVDQTRQVLYLVRRGKVAAIVHASTGGPGIGVTRDGVWRIWLKFPGYSPKGLFMPSFFDGERAIHGWPDVPPTPASHGCVRVPSWAAPWIYSQVRVGDRVRVYHS